MSADLPTLNVDLLDQTLAYTEAHPETHDQKTWRCDSGQCFAGNVPMVTGIGYPFAADDEHFEWVYEPDPEHSSYEDVAAQLVRRPDGDGFMHVRFYAREALGLTPRESAELFASWNTMDDLRDKVARVKAGEFR